MIHRPSSFMSKLISTFRMAIHKKGESYLMKPPSLSHSLSVDKRNLQVVESKPLGDFSFIIIGVFFAGVVYQSY